MRKKILLPLAVLIVSQNLFSQEMLTLDSTLAMALQKNFLVQTGKIKTEISTLNNTPGNAGMLPKISASASGTASLSNVDQKSSAAGEVKYNNDTGSTFNASVTATWTLFDGLKMFATKGRLKKLKEIGDLNYLDTLQTVITQVIDAYYDVASAAQQLAGLKKAVEVFGERVKIAQKQFQVGMISKVDLLQANVDLNEQKSGVLSQENLLLQKKIALNTLIARSPEVDFVTADSIPFTDGPHRLSSDELEAKNYQLIAAHKNVEAAVFAKREAISLFSPTLSVSGGYGLSQSQNSAGQSLYNQSYGPVGGITLTLPLFNGFNTLDQVRIADLNLSGSRIALYNIRLQIQSRFYQAWKNFESAKTALKLEEENFQLADENQKIALERFRVGESTSIEMRTAEQSYVNAVSRLVSARFNAKSDETELMRLQGELVK